MKALSAATLAALALAGCQSNVPAYMQPKQYPGYSQEQIDRCTVASFKEIPQAVGTMQLSSPVYVGAGGNLTQGQGRTVPVDMNRGLRERYIERCLKQGARK